MYFSSDFIFQLCCATAIIFILIHQNPTCIYTGTDSEHLSDLKCQEHIPKYVTPPLSFLKNSDFQQLLFRFYTTATPIPSSTFLSARNLIIVSYSHIQISFSELADRNKVPNTHV